MIFPIKGSTGSAVVSVFATKEAGKYVIRQLGIQTVFGTASFPFLNPCSRFTHRSHSAADDIHLTGDRVAALYLTSACHAQDGNQISRLDGVVFPAGLTFLFLVSF